MKDNAIILVAGNFNQSIGKTAHGLIRKSKKYKIVGIIDDNFSGNDAGELLDGKNRNIPVYSSVRNFEIESPVKANFAIVGIALPGGTIPDNLKTEIIDSIKSGMSIVSGLHTFLSEDKDLAALAERQNVSIIDIRKLGGRGCQLLTPRLPPLVKPLPPWLRIPSMSMSANFSPPPQLVSCH